MDSDYESSLVDPRSRKRVRFADAELGSDGYGLNPEASSSQDPLSSAIAFQPSGFLPPSSLRGKSAQVTPIPSHRPAPASHDILPRHSARELFNSLPKHPRPEAPRPSARELFNRLSQSRRLEGLPNREMNSSSQDDRQGQNNPQKPSVRDLYKRLRPPDHTPKADGPKSNVGNVFGRPPPSSEQKSKNTARQLFNRLPPPDRPGSNPLAQLSDLYSALPRPSFPSPASTAPEPSLPAKPNNSSAVPKVVIDLTDDHYVPMLPFEAKKPIAPKGLISADTHPADVKAAHPSILAEDPHQYIFNTTDDLATRQTERSWAGSYRADDWVFGREELHADQVDRDRSLPILLWDAGYPLFAISPEEIRSLHKYLAARYNFEDYETYKLVLAGYRNTRAIEAYKARDRYSNLVSFSDSVEKCRQRLVNLSEDQHPT